MSDASFAATLNWACGALLLTAVLIVWRRELVAIVRQLALQGALLAAVAALVAGHDGTGELYAVAAGLLAVKAVALPAVLHRVVRDTGHTRDAEPMVNTPASLVATAALTLLAYVVCRPLVALAPGPAARALPVGFALVLLGFFVLVTRRQAV